METVAELFAAFGVKLDNASIAQATAAIEKLKSAGRALEQQFAGAFQDKAGRWRAANGRFLTMSERAALLGEQFDQTSGKASGLGSAIDRALKAVMVFFGFRAAKKGLIDYNSTLEDARNQIAGMFALSKKTDLADQYATADRMIENLRRRAATLPGTTMEYVRMLGMLTQPLTRAGLDLQTIEDITVNAVVGAKALGVEWQVAARDVDQAIRGQYHSVDVFTGKILSSYDDRYSGEKGRKLYNSKSMKERAEILKAALTQKQLSQLADAQGKTFSGVMSTLQDSIEQFLGKVGVPLFKAIGDQIRSWNKWLSENEKSVKALAETIGGILTKAWSVLSEVVGVAVDIFGIFLDQGGATESLIAAITVAMVAFGVKAAAAWIAGFAPIIGIIAALTAVGMIIYDVFTSITEGKGVIATVLTWIADRFRGMGRTILDAFRAVGNFFRGIAISIKDAFVAVIDWITDKISWAWEQIKRIGHYITNPTDIFSDAYDYVTGGDDDSSAPPMVRAAQQATRVVPVNKQSTVTVSAPTTITIDAPHANADEVSDMVDRKIKDHHEKVWRDVGAATGAEDVED